MKTFVMGDIHGQYTALVGCLTAAGFNYDHDRLITLGDVCDRGPQVKECIDELLKIRHLIFILGNHDAMTLEWAIYGELTNEWLHQGGSATALSYKDGGMPKEHITLLAKAPLYFDDGRRLFVHGGFDVELGVEETPKEIFLWDRGLYDSAEQLHPTCPEWKFGDYDEIFIGHTPTLFQKKNVPVKLCNVWIMDTGACFRGGKLTIMDVDTKQFWQA